ncbi:uncharacterized protein SPAPADRAFT_62460 [Spathaspora passalidarum NRRL Y-27907]|uniref:Uncharacterized protein n=1 Tax=Spathaspora passalidarum (strain NRRL Y-27907 / 11-Y1) TaxID=619300 RepID=G3AS01_SPAPN|nr:uncharacterized protein SPAPADRAFT_62460 [Spathaspora passalidarum NRRL Y-27907]EGW31850.1 hypothetical protein SPAPADRAFT_62460 [Spathaspora passalidarum NRRL Y-27907]
MSVDSCNSETFDNNIGNLPNKNLTMTSKVLHTSGGTPSSSSIATTTNGVTNTNNIPILNDNHAPRDIRHTIQTHTVAASGTTAGAAAAAAATVLLPPDLTPSYPYDEPDEDEYNMHIGTQPPPRIYTDEHPEPELLPTTVGRDSQGRIIPSTSTISLLSLNQQPDMSMTSPKIIVSNPPVFIDRKNSFGQLRNLINHKRLQPYQKMNSPNEYTFMTTTTQSIPIQEEHVLQPPSPNLDPVSLGGSPSRFWLNSPTITKSLSKTQLQYTQNTQTLHSYQKQQQFHPLAPIPQSVELPMQQTDSELYINIQHRNGSHSPTLDPVQTPSEDPPMTPLSLNRAVNGYSTDYFNLDSVMQKNKEDEANY